MSGDRERLLATLQHNTGFHAPKLWIDYARRHGFKRIAAVKMPRCPDCAVAHPKRGWGQYIYYSTLIHLLECRHCRLVWADAHIESDTIRQHFEVAYKEDDYFRESRKAIFEHLAAVIDGLAPRGARILDIGGARGDLMATVVARRPDLNVTVNDLSKIATDWAAMHFGFTTLTGDANTLATHSEQYAVVVLSDVLYYEPNLSVLWSVLSRLTSWGGSIVLRLPNKALLIRLGHIWFQLTHTKVRRMLQDRVPFYNPEHIFLFRQRYLRNRLKSIGCTRVQFVPSPLLRTAKSPAAHAALFRLASIINRMSRGSLVLTPSMLVVGARRGADSTHVM
jgi:2-polyprenyl-3-methyl-5-hydroxy-6-metoxy-1,4-benzoquinol methylase